MKSGIKSNVCKSLLSVASAMMLGLSVQVFAENEDFILTMAERISAIQASGRLQSDEEAEQLRQIEVIINSGLIETSPAIEIEKRKRRMIAGLDRSGETLATTLSLLREIVGDGDIVAVEEGLTFAQRVQTRITQIRKNQEAAMICRDPLEKIEIAVLHRDFSTIKIPNDIAEKILENLVYDRRSFCTKILIAHDTLVETANELILDLDTQRWTLVKNDLMPMFIRCLQDILARLYACLPINDHEEVPQLAIDDGDRENPVEWPQVSVLNRAFNEAISQKLLREEGAEGINAEFNDRKNILIDSFLELVAMGGGYGEVVREYKVAHQLEDNITIPSPQISPFYNALIAAPELQFGAIRDYHEIQVVEAERLRLEQEEQEREADHEDKLLNISKLLNVDIEILRAENEEQLTARLRAQLVARWTENNTAQARLEAANQRAQRMDLQTAMMTLERLG